MHCPADVTGETLYEFDNEWCFHAVKQWAWGLTSAVQLQLEASTILADQVALLGRVGVSPDHASKNLRDFAALGAHGQYKGNASRDLATKLGEPSLPAPFYAQVPMVISKPAAVGATTEVLPFPILLPHELFAYIYNESKDRFGEYFMDGTFDPDNLHAFWRGV